MKTFCSILFLLFFLSFSINAQSVDTKAPDFTLNLLNGGSFTLSDHQGKVVFIFFFGYACPHCLANGPNTQDGIYSKFQSNADFVAVGVDTWDGNSAGVENFQSSTGVQYPLCMMGGVLEDTYQTTYDRIVVIDKNGIIKFKSTSDATSPVVNQAADIIEMLLGEDEPMDDEPPMDDPPGEVTGLEESVMYDERGLIFPVPVRSTLNINTEHLVAGEYSINIYDIKGQPIYEGNRLKDGDDDNFSLDLPLVSDGLYLLQLSSNRYTIVRKFLLRK